MGTDGSRGAEFTIETFARFADPSRTYITVVSAVPLSSPLMAPVPGPTFLPAGVLEQNQELQRRMHEEATRHAETAATLCATPVSRLRLTPCPATRPNNCSKRPRREESDLVAVGSRGLGPFRRALLGSVSDHVVRHSRAALVGRRLTT